MRTLRHHLLPQSRTTLRRIAAALLFGLFLALAPLRIFATTVVPPEFDSLVSQADYIVRAVVKSVTAEWRLEGPQRHIITKVELEVREVIAGMPPQRLVLELLGGKIGDEELVVHGVPRFYVGQEDILFIHGNGTQFCPLVALTHGRYPIQRELATGRALVARSNGRPLYSEKDVALPMAEIAHPPPAGAQALSAAEFSSKIRVSFQNSHRPRAN